MMTAKEHLEQERRRIRFRKELERKMKGSEEAKRALAAKYEATQLGRWPPLIWED